jgi:hypothetical protein
MWMHNVHYYCLLADRRYFSMFNLSKLTNCTFISNSRVTTSWHRTRHHQGHYRMKEYQRAIPADSLFQWTVMALGLQFSNFSGFLISTSCNTSNYTFTLSTIASPTAIPCPLVNPPALHYNFGVC